MRGGWVAMALALLAAAPARADGVLRPVVVELFTSQGCSSCPPADALLSEFSRDRGDLLTLTFHVTYWNSLGWRDPFSSEAWTARQRRYAVLLGHDNVYTPEMVVDGTSDVIGSDRSAVLAAIHTAARTIGASTPVAVARRGKDVAIDIAAGVGAGRILLLGYDSQHSTPVARGENGGRTLVEANIVRSVTAAGDWHGQQASLLVPAPAGERMAVIVQSDDGHILGAGLLR